MSFRALTAPRGSSRLLRLLAAAAFVIGFVNFLWFFAESSTIGDANRGYVRDGRYYLVNAGRATEVTQAAFEWSRIHGVSLLLTHPLAMAGAAYLAFTVTFPVMVGASRGPDARMRVERIRDSGQILARARMGARLGDLRLTRPLVAVEVRRGGIVLSPFGLTPIGIESTAISGVAEDRSLLRGRGVIVTHRQAGVSSVRLVVDVDDPIVRAVRAIAAASTESADRAESTIGVVGPSEPTATSPYPAQMKWMILGGFGLSIVFAVVAVPFSLRLGIFGIVWTIGLIGIIAFNAWTWFVRNRDRW